MRKLNACKIGKVAALTQNPISAYNAATSHAFLRSLNYCLKSLMRDSPAGKKTTKKKEAKKKMIAMINTKTGVAVDMSDAVGAGGTLTTGNTAKTLLFDPEKCQVLIECIPQKVWSDQECDRVVNFSIS